MVEVLGAALHCKRARLTDHSSWDPRPVNNGPGTDNSFKQVVRYGNSAARQAVISL